MNPRGLIDPDDFKFRDREHVVSKLVSSDTTAYDRWAWGRLIDALDGKGLAIVTKPVNRDRGRPNRRPS